MSDDTSPRLELPYLMPSQAQKHVTHNEALKRLDALVQLSVEALDAETPPLAPAAGAVWGLGAAPTGDWAGRAGDLAVWDGVAWSFVAPQEGWRAWDRSLGGFCIFDGAVWAPVAVGTQMLDGVGIGTTSDATNRLSVQADAALFSHAGAGHQLKINKAGAGDTASLLFQSGWTGHAEMGLAGDTDFALKVSADGSAWHDALTVDAGAGQIALAPAGPVRATLSDSALALDVPLTGTAVQAGHVDATSGRVLTVGAFGLGARDSSAAVVNDAHDDLPTGFFGGGGSAATQFPGGANYRPFLNMNRRINSGTYRQLRMFFGDDNVPTLRSSDDQGVTWDSENTLFGRRNVLGTVSQSGGVPTGAVIEQGSNANGEYVRFADGTQLCWTQRSVNVTTAASGAVHISTSDFGAWVFPVGFSGTPNVQASVEGAAQWANPGAALATQIATVVIFSTAALSAASRTVKAMAVGRWF